MKNFKCSIHWFHKKTTIVLLMLVGFVDGKLQAQRVENPGYMGKTITLGLGSQVSGGWYGGFKTQAFLTAVAEKSINRQHAITLRATVGMLNVPFQEMGLSVALDQKPVETMSPKSRLDALKAMLNKTVAP